MSHDLCMSMVEAAFNADLILKSEGPWKTARCQKVLHHFACAVGSSLDSAEVYLCKAVRSAHLRLGRNDVNGRFGSLQEIAETLVGHTTHILAIEGRQIRSLAVTRVDEVHVPFCRCVRGFVRRIPFSGFGAGVERGATACVDNESAHEPYPNGNPPPPPPRAARPPRNLAPSVPSARHRYYSWHPVCGNSVPSI